MIVQLPSEFPWDVLRDPAVQGTLLLLCMAWLTGITKRVMKHSTKIERLSVLMENHFHDLPERVQKLEEAQKPRIIEE